MTQAEQVYGGQSTAKAVRWSRRRLGLIMSVAVAAAATLVLAWYVTQRGPHWGTPTERVASPSREFELVKYEFSAMIDPGWNIAIQRVGGDGREWIWRSVELRAPAAMTFLGPHTVRVVDDHGDRYEITFNPDSLQPSDRYCLNRQYCRSRPWDAYTRNKP